MSPIAFNTVALCLSFSFRPHLNVAEKCNVYVSTLVSLNYCLNQYFAIYHIAHVTVFEGELRPLSKPFHERIKCHIYIWLFPETATFYLLLSVLSIAGTFDNFMLNLHVLRRQKCAHILRLNKYSK